jgi:hypothetical protein
MRHSRYLFLFLLISLCAVLLIAPARTHAITYGFVDSNNTKGESSGLFLAGVYAGLGDKDQAFAWLEKDFQQRSGQLPTIAFRLHFEDLRSDPRYADLLRRMGLKQ